LSHLQVIDLLLMLQGAGAQQAHHGVHVGSQLGICGAAVRAAQNALKNKK
jgi:hypothetical protein